MAPYPGCCAHSAAMPSPLYFLQKGCLCWCHKTPIVLSKTPRMKAILQEAEQVALSPDAQKKDTTCALPLAPDAQQSRQLASQAA